MKVNRSKNMPRIIALESKRRRERQAIQIETMIAELDRLCAVLEHQIEAEENRARIFDPSHFAYPTYATAVRERRANIHRSKNALRLELERLRSDTDEGGEALHAA